MNPFEVLGLEEDATENEIHEKFKKIIRNFYPRLYKGNDRDIKNFQNLSESYVILTNKSIRYKFDNLYRISHNINYAELVNHDIGVMIYNIEMTIVKKYMEAEKYRKLSQKKIILGIILSTVGFLITSISYLTTFYGGFFVLYGLVVVGLIEIFKGVGFANQTTYILNKLEEDLWS